MIKIQFGFVIVLFCHQLSSYDTWMFSNPQSNFIDYSNNIRVKLSGFMTAFGDFDANRMVDIFVLDRTDNIQHVDVILMEKDKQKRITLFNDTNNSIRNLVVGDFDGDSLLDIVTYNSPTKTGPYSLQIAYGQLDRNSVSLPTRIEPNIEFLFQPLHCDWNADMIGDFFGQNGTKFVTLIGNANRSFSLVTLDSLVPPDVHLQSVLFSFFVDLNEDGQSDLLLMGEIKSEQRLALIGFIKRTSDDRFEYQAPLRFLPEGFAKVGRPAVADFSFNGRLELAVPVCGDKACQDSKLLVCALWAWGDKGECRQANLTRVINGEMYSFVVVDNDSTANGLASPEIAPMACGDIKMSGSIGCVLPVRKTTGDMRDSILMRLENNGNARFTLVKLETSAKITNVSQAALFDLHENGILDLLITTNDGNTGKITPLIQEPSEDPYFLKVMVLNGLCDSANNCPGSILPYGLPLPGVIVKYSTDGVNGKPQSSMISMVPSSAYTPLSLPYAVFGLSTFSNYIEKLVIQLPYKKVVRKHTLTFIVPKTQIVIIPHPLDDPDKWKNKLFLEPFADKKVIYVAAALLGTMFVVAIILCIFQYLEIREDKLEKMQEAQKFNFDAM